MNSKIIVITPVKNEDWILKQFLKATSQFADVILVADQNSTDQSREICREFKKVILISNEDVFFNEANRQKLLISKARELFPDCNRILFGLDADEIITFDSLKKSNLWQEIRQYEKGTTLYFEKPDILPGIAECVRWRRNYFPIGYIDDGIEHSPKEIHSRRVPSNPNGKAIYVDEVKFMHFAISRNKVQSAKTRYYSVIENIKSTKPAYLRRYMYKSYFDPRREYPKENFETIRKDWIEGWKNNDVNLYNLFEPEYSWQDVEVLKIFSIYGCDKFHWDNIWDFDWDNLLGKVRYENHLSNLNIVRPTILKKFAALFIDLMYRCYIHLRSIRSRLVILLNKIRRIHEM